MQAKTQQNGRRHGSAMIFVVIVTVLLAVVGVMFVMVARVGEMQTSAVIDSGDLSTAVDSVVGRIHTVLLEDLFGADGQMLNADADPLKPGADEREDYPSHKLRAKTGNWDDPIDPGANGVINPNQIVGNDDIWLPGKLDDIWLASLEPKYQGPGPDGIAGTSDDIYVWSRVSDLWGTLQGQPDSLYYQRFTNNDHQWFYKNNLVAKRWIDPDDDTNASQWSPGSWNQYGVKAYDVQAKIISPDDRSQVILEGSGANGWSNSNNLSPYGARADADGDGVADSRWVKVPNLTTSRGKPVFAAIRIIDNCAMLNLNTAHCFYQDPTIVAANPDTSPFRKAWYPTKNLFQTQPVLGKYQAEGRLLTEVNYRSFLRGSDLTGPAAPYDQNWYNLQKARGLWNLVSGVPLTPEQSHNTILNYIDSTVPPYAFFDIGDELEIRNRYLVTSKAEMRFERMDVANFTLDAGGSLYAALRTPVDDATAFNSWKIRLNPANFDIFGTPAPSFPYYYDRRHISTFYSFDRPLRSGKYASLETALAAELALLKSNAALTDAQRLAKLRAIESVFRPLDSRPLDIRTITSPLKIDGVTANPECITTNTLEARKNILHLLYAFRAFYTEKGLAQAEAAKKSAQIVANLIDYLDADTATATGPFGDAIYGSQINANPTYINRSMVQQLILEVSGALPAPNNTPIDIGAAVLTPPSPYEFGLGVTDATETAYGYERQPFITELYSRVSDAGAVEVFAMELLNPYDTEIKLRNPFDAANNIPEWRVVFVSTGGVEKTFNIPNTTVPSGWGRLVLSSHNPPQVPISAGIPVVINNLGVAELKTARAIYLQRLVSTNPVVYLTVDSVPKSQIDEITTDVLDGFPTYHSSMRDDNGWKITNSAKYSHTSDRINPLAKLGISNGVTINDTKNYQLPVANAGGPIYTLGDFVKAAFVSSQKGGAAPKTITEQIADAADESAIRYDVANVNDKKLLDYICFLNRPEKGSLPGRININTAAKHVIAAAIPPQLVVTTGDPENALNLADQIIANRPYQRVSDLLTKVPAMQKFKNHATVNVGDQLIRGDFEERDWILSRLSNIFTVRSDVFTAYILVRLGEDGPERRMMAIFDRSQCWTPTDRPKLVALHPVPDPR